MKFDAFNNLLNTSLLSNIYTKSIFSKHNNVHYFKYIIQHETEVNTVYLFGLLHETLAITKLYFSIDYHFIDDSKL